MTQSKLVSGTAKLAAAGLLLGAASISQAVLLPDGEYMDSNCGAGSGARHGSSRGGCTQVMNASFGVSQAPANNAGASTFIVPFNAGGPTAPVAPAALPPVVTAPVLAPTTTVAAGPKVVPTTTSAPIPVAPTTTGTTIPGPTTTVPTGTTPAPITPFAAVPEPSTGLLLLGGLAALVGIRRRRVR